jgi:hypothetical protein
MYLGIQDVNGSLVTLVIISYLAIVCYHGDFVWHVCMV